ncbi:hypothetical protein IFR05_016245, partial [Cadophora sp. M221]
MGDSLTGFTFTEVLRDFIPPLGMFDMTSSNGGNISDQTDAPLQSNPLLNTLTPGFIDDSEMQSSSVPQEEPTSFLQSYNQRKLAKTDRHGPNPTHSAIDLIRLLRLNNNNSANLSVLKTAISRGYEVRDVFLAGLSTLDNGGSMHGTTSSDPKKNTLTLIRISILRPTSPSQLLSRYPLNSSTSQPASLHSTNQNILNREMPGNNNK